MNTNTNMDKTFNSVPFWKVLCGSVINIVLILMISELIYVVWKLMGIPDFSYLWPILILISSVLLSVVRLSYGRSLGFIILGINSSASQDKIATLCSNGIIYGIAFTMIAMPYLSKSDSGITENDYSAITVDNGYSADQIIENDYYNITVPSGWSAEESTERNPLLYCIVVGKDSNNNALFFTDNYNTSGISFDALTAMVLGGFDRGNFQNIEVKETEFQNCKAVRVDGTLNGIQTETIIFLAPSGRLSYIMNQNLSEQEFDSLLSGVHLKDTQSPFADFDAVWKHFCGDKLESKIYQIIEEGLYLEGWKYDKQNNTVSMNIVFETDANSIRDFFNESENKNNFINGMCQASEVMIHLANNYNKSILITIKDVNGNAVLSLPISPKDLVAQQE